jgi:acyl carrier protein
MKDRYMTEELIAQVKKLIIDSLRIEGMAPEEIDTDAPLFGEGLGLDSIDALQLVVAMERDFGVVVPDAATGTKVFRSVRGMAEYIAENRK